MPKHSAFGTYVNSILASDTQLEHVNAAEKLNIEIANESMVLLKNTNNYLPLGRFSKTTSSGRTTISGADKVTVFGANSLKMLTGGGGSGASSTSTGFQGVDFYRALELADFEVNQAYKDFYTYANGTGFDMTVPVLDAATGAVKSTTTKKIQSGMKNNTNYEAVNDVTIGEAPLAWYETYSQMSGKPNLDEVLKDGADDNTFQKGAAIFFIARAGTEGFDVKAIDNRDFWFDPINDRHALELTANETALLDKVETYFDNVIVVINAGTAFECDRFDKDPKVKAVIWMGTPGNNGAIAVGNIIRGYRYETYQSEVATGEKDEDDNPIYRNANGEEKVGRVVAKGKTIPVSPAGKTIDTWYRDFQKDPTYQNFSLNDQTNPGNNKDSGEFEGYYPNITMFDHNGEPIRSLGTYMPSTNTNITGYECNTCHHVHETKPAAACGFEDCEGTKFTTLYQSYWVDKYGGTPNDVTYSAYGGAEFKENCGWNWDDGKRQSGNNQNGTGFLPYPNYADHKVVEGGLNGCRPSQYVSYEEGIYVDYRYYETRWAELEAKEEGSGEAWYKGEEGVIYPFGYGLSYTSFSQKILSCSAAGKDIDEDTDVISVDVKVTNTGKKAGKEAVQLYWKAPYTKGGIEKAYEVLCGVDKTKELKPGESQVITITFHPQDFANYDFSDANNNGFKGYELDGGDYALSCNKNAHEVYDEISLKVKSSGIKYENDRITGTKVENQFTDKGFYDCLPGEKDIGFQQMTRGDFSNADYTENYVLKMHPTMAERTLKEGSRVQEFFDHAFHIWDVDVEKDWDYMPEEAYKTEKDIKDLGWSQVEKVNNVFGSYDEDGEFVPQDTSKLMQLSEMTGVYDLNDPRWDVILNSLTFDELTDLVDGGNPHNPGIDRIGKVSPSDNDGPNQYKAGNTMFWCGEPLIAASFNPDIAQAQGDIIGLELQRATSYGGWCGPACNLHRSPFGGRNFEYYSSDPFLSGVMCARVCAGATDAGMYCYFKHFYANDQEDGREGVISYLTEQAARELYLKPFQMGIQNGKAMGIMSSYNRVGLMETAANYNLLINVLRKEWGFNGAIFSDMTHHSNSRFHHLFYENINNRVLAGDTNQLDGSSFNKEIDCKWDTELGAPAFEYDDDKLPSYSWWYAVRTMAKEQLYIVANTAMSDNAQARRANLVEVEGVVRRCIDLPLNEKVDLTVDTEAYAPGNYYKGQRIYKSNISLDEKNPLPYGLELVNGHIVGTPTQAFNTFSHLILELTFITDNDTLETITLGVSVEFTVVAKGGYKEVIVDPVDPVDPTDPTDPTDPVDPVAHEHSWLPDWTVNGTSHWHSCTGCAEKYGEGAHTFDANGRCTVCGYSDGRTPTPVDPVDPEPSKGCGGAILGASLLAFTLAAAGAVLFLKKKED